MRFMPTLSTLSITSTLSTAPLARLSTYVLNMNPFIKIHTEVSWNISPVSYN
jgi:hypothetical protein